MALLIRKLGFICLCLMLGSGIATRAHAAETLQLYEQEIKAGLLYNFLKYTEWPEASMAPAASVVVCMLGDDPLGSYLQPMAERSVNQRTITLKTIHTNQETAGCHLLFITAHAKGQWPELLNIIAGKNILTVSDSSEFISSGGMIQFGRRDNRISVELNMEAVTDAKLHVQDRLLKLVTVVHKETP